MLGDILRVLDVSWLTFAAFAEDDAGGSALSEAAFVMAVLTALSGAFV